MFENFSLLKRTHIKIEGCCWFKGVIVYYLLEDYSLAAKILFKTVHIIHFDASYDVDLTHISDRKGAFSFSFSVDHPEFPTYFTANDW